MTLDEAIERYSHNAEYERANGNLQGCLEFRQLAEWLKDYKRLKEQDSCEDCVSRDKVHEMLENIPINPNDKWFNWLQKACLRLAEMPSVQPKAEWIPVSERLPEDGTWNLWTNGRLLPSVERYKLDAMDHFYPDGRWFEFEDAVAWMPLPKLYKTESEVEADKQSGDRE